MKKFIASLAAFILLASVPCLANNLPDFTQLVDKCGAAVVNINTERKSAAADEMFGEMFRNMPPGFEKFFDQFGGRNPKGPNRAPHKQKSLGSGFFVSSDGYIVTNNHVVADADVIRVTMDDKYGKTRNFTAKLIGADEETDLALLKVEGTNLPFLAFGNSAALKVGEWVLAIGNPFGLDHTVTAGILSAIGRNIHSGPFDNFLQTDASINPGNSGGPLLNMSGQVIGINTAITASGQGIGFAIPSDMAAKIIDQIKNGKKVSRGWIGVTIQDIDENASKALGLADSNGALVGRVLENEPAAKAGVQDGDVIIAVDNEKVSNSAELLRAIADKKPGSTASLTIWRNGKTMTLNVTLGERKSSVANSSSGDAKTNKAENIIGISVRSLKESERKDLNIPASEGLYITEVDPDKSAAEADLRPGDIILKANMTPVNTPDQLSRIVKDEGAKRGAVILQIKRGNDVYFRAVNLGK